MSPQSSSVRGFAGVRQDSRPQLGQLVPGVDTHDALCDSGRKLVGPFVNGLVRDAHRLGSRRDGAAEEFNGFGFQHGRI